jgi:pimeloyl-ACP methyl ester carboxylesterase
MLKPLLASAAIIALLGAAAVSAQQPPAAVSAAPALKFEPYTFEGPKGVKVEAEKGTFEVPENRADPKSRKIKISFVRFKSTAAKPGPPIVYLAGGPGGSGVESARGGRFPLFMALREVSDVIALDQRGVGMSSPMIPCAAKQKFDGRFTRDVMVAHFRRELTDCFEQWKKNGVDIDGYTTLESAHDLDDLRKALGVPKIDLWGISYGSHLGLAAMKYHPDAIDRVVLSGIEGLDQTIKRPALTDRVFAHVQEIIDADPKAKALYPDLLGMMRRVHAKLNANPATITFTPQGATEPMSITFDGFAIQLLTSSSTADPPGFANAPLVYYALDHGQYDKVGPMLNSMSRMASGFRGMPEAMDLASGATQARLKLVTEEAKTSLLADALNFPMPQVMGIRDQIDLGDSFRAPFKSDIPGLFISATLDGRTYPDEAKEEIKGFTNARRLIVENGGHNIYEADKRVQDAVVAFFKGQPTPATIHFDPPKIAMP